MQGAPLGPLTEHVRTIVARSKSTSEQKLRGLYVDYSSGTILLPDKIAEPVARKQIEAVRSALTLADSSFPPDFFSDEMFEQAMELIPNLRDAFAADPGTLAAALQEAFRDGSEEAFKALVLKTLSGTGDGHLNVLGGEE